MFGGATTFNNGAAPGVGGKPFTRTPGSIWDTGLVNNFSGLFINCAAFNQNVSSWDTHSATGLEVMFAGATTFNNGAEPGVGGVPFTRTPGSIWDTGLVNNFSGLFTNCAAFNQNVSSWDTHSVEYMAEMFSGATTFNNGADPGVGGVPFTRTPGSIWDTGAVVDMVRMFNNCAAFNQNVSSWDTHSATDMEDMFYGATLFIGTGLDVWQLTLKPNILEMFVNSAVPGSVNNNLIWNTWKTQYAYSIAELAAAGLIEPIPTPTPTPIVSDICFPAGTPIKTDQGVIPIELLTPGKHTIRRQSIEHVTQTVTLDKYLIAFQPNAVDYKVPNKKTIMSKDHCIVFKGQLVPAYRFLDYSDQVKKVTYSGELLYNVLLATHGVMEVNNMQCETLHPANTIAKVYQNRYKAKLLPMTKKNIMN
jgi:surface protein